MPKASTPAAPRNPLAWSQPQKLNHGSPRTTRESTLRNRTRRESSHFRPLSRALWHDGTVADRKPTLGDTAGTAGLGCGTTVKDTVSIARSVDSGHAVSSAFLRPSAGVSPVFNCHIFYLVNVTVKIGQLNKLLACAIFVDSTTESSILAET